MTNETADSPKVLLICGGMQTFTQIDLHILEDAFETRCVWVKRNSPLNLVRTILQSVWQVFWADVVVVWFGSYFALPPLVIATILRRKKAIIASGYDLANVPEINYGNMRPGIRRWIGLVNFALADEIFAVSHFAKSEAIRNVGLDPDRITVIVHGIPLTSRDNCKGEKRRQILMIANVAESTLALKGLFTYTRVAALLPNTRFLLVGPHFDASVEELRAIAPPNLSILGPRYGAELQAIMEESAVYTQLSAYESFGMALAESMAACCVPVVTNRASLPEVVGNTGYQVGYGDVVGTALALHKALDASPEAGEKARERILTEFALEKRRDALVNAIRAMVA